MKKLKVRITFRWLKLVCKLPIVKISIKRPKDEKPIGEWHEQKKTKVEPLKCSECNGKLTTLHFKLPNGDRICSQCLFEKQGNKKIQKIKFISGVKK